MENSSLTHASLLNCYTIFLKQIILCASAVSQHKCLTRGAVYAKRYTFWSPGSLAMIYILLVIIQYIDNKLLLDKS